MSTRQFTLLVPTMLLLSACGADRSNYPSLLPRPIETRGEAETVPSAPRVAVPDPALNAQISAASAGRVAQMRRFDALAAAAERLAMAARGAKIGDERWIAAQSALAEVEAARAEALGRVSGLEQLASDRGIAGDPAYAGLDREIADQRQELAREDQRTAAISARLPAP